MLLEGLQLDRYHLQEQIGSGGGGQVYRAIDRHMSVSREIALKVIPLPDKDEDVKQVMTFFLREVQAITQLNHPHILPIFDYGMDPRTKFAYIVMPLCHQGSLATWWQKRILSQQVVTHLLHQAADALQEAHNQKIVHKDVKPQNFLVQKNIDNPSLPDLLLTDFGIAKLHTATFSLGNLLSGTPSYMAPEQWQLKPVYARDQYSLAIMAYELLTGHLPFQGTQEELEDQHHTVQPEPPSSLNPDIPIAIDAVIQRALAKNPNDRYSSITEFYEAFQQAVQSNERGADIHIVFSISETEALIGTEYPLILPEGRTITVSVPENTQNGCQITLEGQGNTSPTSGLAGDLIITIVTKADKSQEQLVAKGLQNIIQHLDKLDNDVSKQNQKLNERIKNLSAYTAQVYPSTIKRTQWLIGIIGGVIGILLLAAGILGTFGYFNLANKTNPTSLYGGILILDDHLSDNSMGYSWDEDSYNNSSPTCEFKDNAYHVIERKQNATQNCFAHASDFGYIAYQTNMTIIQGDYGGLVLRRGNYDYYFRFGNDQSYEIYKVNNDPQSIHQVTTLDQGVPIFYNGQANTVVVVMRSITIELYVNGYLASKVADNSLLNQSGSIGVFASEVSHKTEVAYSDIKIWALTS